jgi:hypothetical protein
MSAADASAYADRLLESLAASHDGPVTLQLHTSSSPPPSILGAEEGDLIEVIQPDGGRETYRLTRRTPTADGFGFTFETELVT